MHLFGVLWYCDSFSDCVHDPNSIPYFILRLSCFCPNLMRRLLQIENWLRNWWINGYTYVHSTCPHKSLLVMTSYFIVWKNRAGQYSTRARDLRIWGDMMMKELLTGGPKWGSEWIDLLTIHIHRHDSCCKIVIFCIMSVLLCSYIGYYFFSWRPSSSSSGMESRDDDLEADFSQ
jgi:hypothetical protein